MSFRTYAAPAGLACLVAIAAGEGHAQARAQPLTLQDALQRALADTPVLKATEQALLGAQAGVRQADRMPNPSLDFAAENLLGSGLYSGIDRTETTLGLSQRLEWSGGRRARTELARADIAIARAGGDLRRQDLMHDVALAYLSVQKAGADLAVAVERAAVARDIVATVQRRVDAARDPLMAGAKAQALLADAEIAVEAARRAEEGAKAQLASFWGGDAGFTVEGSTFAAEAGAELDALNAPELALAEAEVKRSSASIAVEQARGRQDPTFSAGLRYFHETDEAALVFGVSIPLALWDQNEGGIARAQADRSRLRLESETLRRNISREVSAMQNQMQIALAEVEAIDTRLTPAAEDALDFARRGYEQGGFSYLDVLDAQRLLVDARLQRNSALFTYHSARAALARLTGAYAAPSAQ